MSARLAFVGKAGRPHGLSGEFRVRGGDDCGRVLADAARVGAVRTVPGETENVRWFEVRRVRGTDSHPILAFEGIDDRAAAGSLTGVDLVVEPAQHPLAPDEWYFEDLIGCKVTDATVTLGAVAGVFEAPSVDVLDVVLDSGGRLLVPLNRDAVVSVDTTNKAIEIDRKFLAM